MVIHGEFRFRSMPFGCEKPFCQGWNVRLYAARGCTKTAKLGGLRISWKESNRRSVVAEELLKGSFPDRIVQWSISEESKMNNKT